MLRLHHIPGPPLSRFVRLMWLYQGYSQPHAKERVLPTGEMQLVINLLEDKTRIYERDDTEHCQTYRGSVMAGAHSEYMVISTAMQAYIIGVCFRAGGAFPFLRMPAGELRDATVSLDTLWGAAAGGLRDQLLAASSHQRRFEILEQALLAELARGCQPHGAVGFALRRFTTEPRFTTIEGVTDQIGLSAKRFIQVFRDETGFTPKVFCRILRFQRVLGLMEETRMEGRRSVEWARVALDCGYFDQAHFIHDFRAFSGINPTTYLAHRTEHRNHVPLVG